MGTSTAESPQEARAFRQRRVALFGLASGGLGLIFLLFRSAIAVSERDYQEFIDPSFLYHLLGVTVALAAWSSCRTGARSSRAIQAAEALGLVGASVAYQLMGWLLPLAERPETIVILAISYSFMAWAAFVPSPPGASRRTKGRPWASGRPCACNGVSFRWSARVAPGF